MKIILDNDSKDSISLDINDDNKALLSIRLKKDISTTTVITIPLSIDNMENLIAEFTRVKNKVIKNELQ